MANKLGYNKDRVNGFFTSAAVERLQYSWYCKEKQAVISQDNNDLDDLLSSTEDFLFDLTALHSDQAQASSGAPAPNPPCCLGSG